MRKESTDKRDERRPGVDQLRAVATLLVVLLHAAVPYVIAPMPGLKWPVRNTVTSPVVDALFWAIAGAVMPLFLFLSGYFAAQSLRRHPGQFLSSRWRRLGKPLVLFAAVLLPLELYLWLAGMAWDGQIPWRKLQSLKLGPRHAELWGFSHLWYLEYLLIYSVALWAGQRWSQRLRIHEGSAAELLIQKFRNLNVSANSWRIGMAAGACLLLLATPEVSVGFQHGFLPHPAKLLFSGLFFAAGVLEFHHPLRIRWSGKSVLLIAATLFCALLPLMHRQIASPLTGESRIFLAAGLASYAILVAQASWQAAQTRSKVGPAWMARLSQASFWVYLVHHPLVALGHVSLRNSEFPALAQFLLVGSLTLFLSVTTYERLVVGTWLQRFLEGRPPEPSVTTFPAPFPGTVRRAA